MAKKLNLAEHIYGAVHQRQRIKEHLDKVGTIRNRCAKCRTSIPEGKPGRLCKTCREEPDV